MKKTLSLILALLMSASCASYIFADDAAEVEATAAIDEEAVVEEVAEDVETEYNDALTFLTYKNIMHGMEDGLLHPELGVERYQMALFVGRVSTGWVEDSQWEDGTANNSEFEDLAGTAAENVYGAISYANQKGIIEGYGDGTFKPEQGVTYREALTMAVRTLEYNSGLEYPWGYIEKAVSLGLTDGITGVAYTDAINRGVAAQIVYNMLFANTKSGDTLAMRSFGVEFGWQNIIVTANNKTTYEAGAKTTANVGVVGFKVINEDGTLGDETYYLNEDLAVGTMYNALFEKNDKGDYVDIVGAHEYVATAIENKGLTDDEGVKYDDADKIGTFLKDYTLVDKYGSSILANSNLYRDELIVVDGNNKIKVLSYDYKQNGTYAIDWETGDILKRIVDKDDEDKDDIKDEYSYEVEWFYNGIYDYYFRYQEANVIDDSDRDGKYDEKSDKIALIGYDIMDDKDLADLKEAIKKAGEKWDETDANGYVVLGEKPATSAYALLLTYDLNGDDKADYATYEAYKLAKYEIANNDNTKCSKCDKKYDGYKFGGLNLANSGNGDLYYMPEGVCDHYSIKDGKIGEKYSESWTFAADSITPESGDYVIYGVNNATNELKVVKIIEKLGENTDADSYYANGVVRGFSRSKNTVTIDNTNYEYDYSTLKGTAFVKVGDNEDLYSDALEAALNQFVKYVVVDGKLVDIDIVGATTDEYIVVDSYAGIDSEGYIVVNGYLTSELKYNQFRIGSYNGWKTGDFFFYEDEIEAEFVKGSVYHITSKDADAEYGAIYYVECLAEVIYEDQDGTYTEIVPVNGKWAYGDGSYYTNFSFLDGYRTITYYNTKDDGSIETKDVVKRVTENDQYIILPNGNEWKMNGFMPIFVYTGKVPDGWNVSGDVLLAKDNKTFIIVNATNYVGFQEDFNAETGYVVILNKKLTEVNYNGYGQDYYLYGAVKYTVKAFDLLTASNDEVNVTTNVKVEEGKIYRTISNTIIDNTLGTFDQWIAELVYDNNPADPYDWNVNPYDDDDAETADYLVKVFNFDIKYLETDKEDDREKGRRDLSLDVISDLVFPTSTKDYKDLTDGGKTVKIVTIDNKNLVTGIKDLDEAAFQRMLDKNASEGVTKTYQAFVVYDVSDYKSVVYVLDYAGRVTTTKTTTVDAKVANRIEIVADEAYVDVNAKVSKTTVNNVVTKITLDSITVEFNGEATEGMHNYIYNNGYNFGPKGTCDKQGATKVTAWNAVENMYEDTIFTDVVKENIYKCTADVCDTFDGVAENCPMIKGFTVTLNDFELDRNGDNNVTIESNGWVISLQAKYDAATGDVKLEIKSGDGVTLAQSKVWLGTPTAGTYVYLNDAMIKNIDPANH